MIEFNLKGMDDLTLALKGVPKKISKEVASDSMTIAVRPLVMAIASYAPVDSGDLKRSIGWVIRQYKTGVTLAVIGPVRGKGTFRTKKGNLNEPANYAHLVEFGHNTPRSTKGRKNTIGPLAVPAHPFMRPAWEATKEQVLNTFNDTFGTRIEAAVKSRKAAR